MLRKKRFKHILDSLQLKQQVTFEELAHSLAVSGDTIRRDIEVLHNNGLVSKVRGGAIPRAKNPLTFQDRETHLKQEKDIIALKAQQLVKKGMTLFMDGGTTIRAVAEYFPVDIKLRIISNNATLIPTLSDYKNIELIIAGGLYNQQLEIFSGANTCSFVSDFAADLYLMGTCGVDHQLGVSASFERDADVKRAMKKSARKTVVLATHERLRSVNPFRVCEISEIDILITNLNSDDDELGLFRNQHLQII